MSPRIIIWRHRDGVIKVLVVEVFLDGAMGRGKELECSKTLNLYGTLYGRVWVHFLHGRGLTSSIDSAVGSNRHPARPLFCVVALTENTIPPGGGGEEDKEEYAEEE